MSSLLRNDSRFLKDVESTIPTGKVKLVPAAVAALEAATKEAASPLVVQVGGILPLKRMCRLQVLSLLPNPPEMFFTSVFCDQDYMTESRWDVLLEVFCRYSMEMSLLDRTKIASVLLKDGNFQDKAIGPITHNENRKQVKEFYRLLATHPALRALIVNRPWADSQEVTRTCPHRSTAALLVLTEFPQITKLEISSYYVRDSDLKVIGTNLVALTYLYVVLHKNVTKTGLSHVSPLMSLETFLFTSELAQFDMCDHINHCLFLMPTLRTIGQTGQFNGYHDFGRFEGDTVVNLERVQLKSDKDIPRSLALPNVSALVFTAEIGNAYARQRAYFPDLPSLTSLTLINYKSQDITHNLMYYGGNLAHLSVKKAVPTEPVLVLGEILQQCPLLRSISLECPLQFSLVQKEHLDQLEDVTLISNNGAKGVTCPKTFFKSFLLRAPLLKKFNIEGPRVHDGDFTDLLKAFVEKPPDKKDEPQLMSLGFHVSPINGRHQIGKCLVQLLQFFPNLVDLTLHVNVKSPVTRSFFLSFMELLKKKKIDTMKVHVIEQ